MNGAGAALRIAMLSPVTPAHGRGGMQDIVWSLAVGLARGGCDVVLVTSAHPEGLGRERREDVEVRYLPVSARSMALTGAGAAWMSVSRNEVQDLHAARSLDVIHSQSYCGIHLAGALPRVPVVATFHGTHVDELRTRAGLIRASVPRMPLDAARWSVLWGLMLWRFASEGRRVAGLDAVIATSREQHGLLHRHYRVPESRLHDVWNGIDEHRFAPIEADPATRLQLGASAGDAIVLAVARLFREKGIHHLVDAWPAVRRAHPAVHLVVVGDGPERASLEARVATLGERGVHFLGSVSFESLPGLYAAADVFVNPTVRINGYDLTILQAMAMGRPVVVSNIGSVPTAVTDGVDGLLVPPGDPRALAETLVRLLTDPAVRSALGARARRTVEQRFSLESMVNGTRKVYERAIKTTRNALAGPA